MFVVSSDYSFPVTTLYKITFVPRLWNNLQLITCWLRQLLATLINIIRYSAQYNQGTYRSILYQISRAEMATYCSWSNLARPSPACRVIHLLKHPPPPSILLCGNIATLLHPLLLSRPRHIHPTRSLAIRYIPARGLELPYILHLCLKVNGLKVHLCAPVQKHPTRNINTT